MSSPWSREPYEDDVPGRLFSQDQDSWRGDLHVGDADAWRGDAEEEAWEDELTLELEDDSEAWRGEAEEDEEHQTMFDWWDDEAA